MATAISAFATAAVLLLGIVSAEAGDVNVTAGDDSRVTIITNTYIVAPTAGIADQAGAGPVETPAAVRPSHWAKPVFANRCSNGRDSRKVVSSDEMLRIGEPCLVSADPRVRGIGMDVFESEG